MNTYRVYVLASQDDVYDIEAESRYDAEEQARRLFNSDYGYNFNSEIQVDVTATEQISP